MTAAFTTLDFSCGVVSLVSRGRHAALGFSASPSTLALAVPPHHRVLRRPRKTFGENTALHVRMCTGTLSGVDILRASGGLKVTKVNVKMMYLCISANKIILGTVPSYDYVLSVCVSPPRRGCGISICIIRDWSPLTNISLRGL